MKGKSAKLQLTWRLGGNAAKNHTMNRRIQQTGLRVPVLLVSLFLAGCETFRPRDFQPPKDSYEYIMQRDGGSAQKGQEKPDLRWIGDSLVGLLKALAHSDR